MSTIILPKPPPAAGHLDQSYPQDIHNTSPPAAIISSLPGTVNQKIIWHFGKKEVDQTANRRYTIRTVRGRTQQKERRRWGFEGTCPGWTGRVRGRSWVADMPHLRSYPQVIHRPLGLFNIITFIRIPPEVIHNPSPNLLILQDKVIHRPPKPI